MADNSLRTPGSGETILTDELTDGTLGTGKAQFVKVMDGTLDSANKLVVNSSGQASVNVANASIAGTAGTPNAGVLSVQGIASMTPVQENQTQVAGTTVDVNTGAATAGTQRVVLATRHEAVATPVAVRPTVDGANFAPAGTGADGATVPRITLSTRHETVSTPLYFRQTVDGAGAAAAGTGADGATVQRMTLSTRHEAAATPVAIRISADGTNFNASGYPITTSAVPGTAAANACSIFQPSSGNIVAGVVKASAGSVYGFSIMNNVAAVTWIQFFNSTSTPTLGTSVVWAVPVPGGAGTGLLILMPGDFAIANFTTGIAWGAATAIAGASAPATAPQGVAFYK